MSIFIRSKLYSVKNTVERHLCKIYGVSYNSGMFIDETDNVSKYELQKQKTDKFLKKTLEREFLKTLIERKEYKERKRNLKSAIKTNKKGLSHIRVTNTMTRSLFRVLEEKRRYDFERHGITYENNLKCNDVHNEIMSILETLDADKH